MYTKKNSESKESRRAWYEKPVNVGMEQGQETDNYTIKLLEI